MGFISLEQAAALCCVSRRTVERWIRLGLRVHQARRGSRILLTQTDVEDFLTNGKRYLSTIDGCPTQSRSHERQEEDKQ